jgi:sugar phosphate isomerase/epimerase
MDLAEGLGAEVVSFLSGGGTMLTDREKAFKNLSNMTKRLLDHAAARGIRLALEPEPGMLIETVADYRALKATLSDPTLYLTLDVGHTHISESLPTESLIQDHADEIVNIHLDDARGSRHEHLPLGTGEVGFTPILSALSRLGKKVYLSVELSRHGHEAVLQAQRSLRFIRMRMNAEKSSGV